MVAIWCYQFLACYCQIADLTLTVLQNKKKFCGSASASGRLHCSHIIIFTCVMASECLSATLIINFINLLELCSPGNKLCSFLFDSKLTLRSVWWLCTRGLFLLAVHTLPARSSTLRLPWKKCAKRLPERTTSLLLRSNDIRDFDLQLNLSHGLENDIFA